MPDKNWQFELEEYIRQGEPERAEKSEAWQTAIGYRRMAEIYAATFDAERTIASLEKESLLRICFDTYEKHQEKTKTSPAVRGCPVAQYLHGNGSQTGDMIERTDDERYDFIRDDPRFKAISLKLRQLKLS